MKLRQHRGSLSKSLLTVVEIAPTREALLHSINSHMPMVVTDEHVTVKPYCFDERIGWDTFIVVIKDYGVYGFTDGPVTETQSPSPPGQESAPPSSPLSPSPGQSL